MVLFVENDEPWVWFPDREPKVSRRLEHPEEPYVEDLDLFED